MIFELHTPVYPLNQFVESFIYYKDYNPVHTVERFLPDGNINLVIDLTDYPKFIYDNHTLKEIQACKRVWFSGIRNTYITIPSGRESEMFVINFQKGRVFPFVEMPMNELTDYVVDGELVMSPAILDMREALLERVTVHHKFKYAEQYLLQLYGSKLVGNPCIDHALERICLMPHQTTISQLSDKIGYSQKHFIQLFKEHVGLSPKAFLKIMRFQKAILEIEQQKKPDWSKVAFESGYYDQAHFVNDFKHFSGFSPSAYTRLNSEYLNYVALD